MDFVESNHQLNMMSQLNEGQQSPWTLFYHSGPSAAYLRLRRLGEYHEVTWYPWYPHCPYSPPRGCTRSMLRPSPIPLTNDILDIILYDGP
ncbi:hypothetical protein Nepgr_013390 [Nepenthes gracilis]|uniref:Uncharacterized protein n=1 Tax=Nepenthes gracilis TaxID=150966 RepID=A0AAD3XP27_NEPGR|nr:hypothetical protein Nepgr_013390 [Nepenthes gracilis]